MPTSGLVVVAERQALRRYVTIETLIASAVNAFMSGVITWLFFHGHALVPTTGGASLVSDAIPQSFMVALMSVLPVSLLTRARARKGRLLPLAPHGIWSGPKNLLVRAVLVAAATAMIGFVGFRFLAPALVPNGVNLTYALILKSAYGAILALIIVPFAAFAALKDVRND